MRMPSVMQGSGRFAKVPTANIPRSQFDLSHGHKTTFDAGYLVPVFLTEVLPGDTFNLKMTAFARLSTPIKPIMDNLYLDSHFFFVPYRILWANFPKMMGEQLTPSSSIAFTIPQHTPTATGYVAGRLEDYFGLPTGVATTNTAWTHSCLPIRAYYKIYNEWFRDQNLVDSATTGNDDDDGPDACPSGGNYLKQRGKRHDYFTSCLPWAQKGDASDIAVTGVSSDGPIFLGATSGETFGIRPGAAAGSGSLDFSTHSSHGGSGGSTSSGEVVSWSDPNLEININNLREAIQVQKLLERDARSGTRYPEKIMAHFGVSDPGMLILEKPLYLGGGSTPVTINPIAQTSGTTSAGSAPVEESQDTEQGNLAGIGTAVASGHGFTQSFTEHGLIMGIVSVRADLNYQEGMERMWSRLTMYDHYFPVFAHLGEQAVLNKELVLEDAASDDEAFGYQERWAEYKYKPSKITGEFRSNHATTLDVWHLAQDFSGSCPSLDTTFIAENPDMARILASSTNHNFLFDSYFRITAARPMPMYSIPGNMDRF